MFVYELCLGNEVEIEIDTHGSPYYQEDQPITICCTARNYIQSFKALLLETNTLQNLSSGCEFNGNQWLASNSLSYP